MSRTKKVYTEHTKKYRGIYRLLQTLNRSLRLFYKMKWNRTLPFCEQIFNRWEKAEFLGFGEGTSIYDSSLVFGDVKIGINTWIGPYSVLDGTGGLEIGSFCSISAGVQIYSHDSVQWALSGGQAEYEYSPVTIGDRCYLGPNVIVGKGVTIGNGCVIGANTVVLKNLPAGTKYIGNHLRHFPSTRMHQGLID